MDRGFDIPWVGECQNPMGRGIKIPCVGMSKYHGWVVRHTMGRGFDILWVAGQNTMDRGIKIPWVEGQNTMDGFDILLIGGQ